MDNVKVALQRGVMSVIAEGNEKFVKEILAEWGHLVGNEHLPTNDASAHAHHPKNFTDAAGTPKSSQYENVYDAVDGKLKIIANMPGGNKADKTRSTALTLLFGHYLEGAEQIPSEMIREACVDQGCFDSANFAKHLKKLEEKIVMNTKAGGGYDVKLTAPGRKAAKELVEELNG